MNTDAPLGPLAMLRWSIVKELVDDLQPKRVLEIGCGQGAFGARIAPSTDYLGVEADPTSFEVARRRIEPAGGRVICGTHADIDPLDTFDLVCAFEVIEHIEDDLGTLTDWLTRVSPGGTAIISAPAWPERYGAWDEMVGHYRRYSPTGLDALLTEAGCRDVQHVVYGWPLGMVTETARNEVAKRRRRSAEASISDRTASSGRMLQPKRFVGLLVSVGVYPFAALHKVRPSAGVGLVSRGVVPGPR